MVESEDMDKKAEESRRKRAEMRRAEEAKKIKQYALIGSVVFIIVAMIALNPFVQVPAGYKGVLLNFGAVSGVLPEGLHLRVPFMQSVQLFEVRTQKYETDATAASSDMQDVYTTVAVNYHPDSSKVDDIYQSIGLEYASKVIAPAVQEAVKASTAQYKAEELIEKRPVVSDEVKKLLTERLSKYNVIVESISITNFRFSDQYTQAIEQKVTSQQQKLNEAQILEIKVIQAQQALAEAQGKANSQLAMATAEANATRVKAEAESSAIQMISRQLAQEPRYIDYIKMQRWDGRLPSVMGGAVPLINMNLSG
jgi:prohibitin 2